MTKQDIEEPKIQLIIKKSTPLPLGTEIHGKSLRFAAAYDNVKTCTLHIYEEEKRIASINIDKQYKTGNIYSILVEGLDMDNIYKYSYYYEVNNKIVVDSYMKLSENISDWGKKQDITQIKSKILYELYNWEDDEFPCIPYNEMIMYHLHVRGFTKDSSSNVENRGTFLGIKEKIPYLKELGINTIELLPAYEFNELLNESKNELLKHQNTNNQKIIDVKRPTINYWGYAKENYYFMPKKAYSTENCVKEFKDMIKELHKNGIEVIMDFHFTTEVSSSLIVDCLRYWAIEYHVDGFNVNQNVVPTKYLATDPVLIDRKIMGTYWDANSIFGSKDCPKNHLAEYNDGFLVDMRRFLKGDEEQVRKAALRIKRNLNNVGVINYFANTNGFTMADLVSYDVKHNEDNGENGRDGTGYNYSWNCGTEGITKRKKVIQLRKKQVMNAFVLLLFSQGVPLILSGDEFGNSQKGNNNAYCQDNKVSWLNWRQADTNKELVEFVKNLIRIRKEHPILHQINELKAMDYASCGCPDISWHGTKSWYLDDSNYSRVLGVLLCGKYAYIARNQKDKSFYIAINMHWESHDFDLPSIPDYTPWKVFLDTDKPADLIDKKYITKKTYTVTPRSIIVFVSSEKQVKGK